MTETWRGDKIILKLREAGLTIDLRFLTMTNKNVLFIGYNNIND